MSVLATGVHRKTLTTVVTADRRLRGHPSYNIAPNLRRRRRGQVASRGPYAFNKVTCANDIKMSNSNNLSLEISRAFKTLTVRP